jgi:hypothetical protein
LDKPLYAQIGNWSIRQINRFGAKTICSYRRGLPQLCQWAKRIDLQYKPVVLSLAALLLFLHTESHQSVE